MTPVNGITPFATPLDIITSQLVAPYSQGNTSVVLAPGTGTLFGNPTQSAPIRFTIFLPTALDIFLRPVNRNQTATFLATNRNGDQLTGVTFESGSNQTFQAGSAVYSLISAGFISDLNSAVNTLEAAIQTRANLTSPNFSGIPASSDQPLATQQWVIAQGYSTGGGGGGGGGGVVEFGTLRFNVLNFGAVADSSTDNSAAFQAAHDHAASVIHGTASKAIIFLPSAIGAYCVSRPTYLDAGNIGWEGEGGGSQVFNLAQFPAFILGVPRSQPVDGSGTLSTLVGDTSYRPDCHGKLDTSAAPAPGAKWGYRTNGKSFFQDMPSPLSRGAISTLGSTLAENWTETQKATFEFCIEPPDSSLLPASMQLLGIGDQRSDPSPICFGVTGSNRLYVVFRTSDLVSGFDPNSVSRSFTVDLSAVSFPARFAFQFDLVNAVCSAFVNGVQVAILDQVNLANSGPHPFAPNSHFIINDHNSFMIGMNGTIGTYDSSSTGVDLRIYGLRISNTLRYQLNGTGQPQLRVDSPSTPLNDAWAFFGNDTHTIAYLCMTDNPATSGRAVTIQNGTAGGGGLTMGMIMSTPSIQLEEGGVSIRKLKIQGFGAYGQQLCLGGIFDTTIEDVDIQGGFHSIGSFPYATSYRVNLFGTNHLGSGDSAYFGAYQLMTQRGYVDFANSGRVTMRFVASSADFDNWFVGGFTPTCEWIVKARSGGYAGNFSFRLGTVDFEGQTVSGGGFMIEAEQYLSETTLVLQDIFIGTLGNGTAIVRLKDVENPGASNRSRGRLQANNVQAAYSSGYEYAAAVMVDGPGWWGDFYGGGVKGTPVANLGTHGSTTNIVYHGPP